MGKSNFILHNERHCNYSAADREMEYCDEYDYVSVCLSVYEHIYRITSLICTKFLWLLWSVLLWWQHTASFLDDVIFAHNDVEQAKRRILKVAQQVQHGFV